MCALNLFYHYIMSSSLRSKATPVGKTTNKFDNINTPSYVDSTLDDEVPIPFSAINGVLDIVITNSAVANFINNGTFPRDNSEYQAKFMGGIRQIHTIGANLETYLRKRITSNEGISGEFAGEIELYIAPIMTKVQLAQPGNVRALTFEEVYGVNDFPPSSDEYIGGDSTNSYYTSWVFKTPMTIKYASLESSTGYRYMTFTTYYDGD
jgi:hypothetical protein